MKCAGILENGKVFFNQFEDRFPLAKNVGQELVAEAFNFEISNEKGGGGVVAYYWKGFSRQTIK